MGPDTGLLPRVRLARWLAAAPVVALVLAGTIGCGGTSGSDEVSVSDPRIETTEASGGETSVYMELESPSTDELVGVRVAGDVASGAEIREAVGSASGGTSAGDQAGPGKGNMVEADDLPDTSSDTRRVSAIPLPAGQEVELQPTGYRITLVGLKGPVESGDEYQLTLEFGKAREVFVQAMAR